MPHSTRRAFVVTLGATSLAGGVAAPAYAEARGGHPGGKPPLREAHVHNDYEHPRPLHDALAHGFSSVETDIWLVDGQLLVAHEEAELDPTRTLELLYLDPLLRRVRAGGGRVYSGHRQSLQLLIDIKNQGDATYRVLSRRLRRYRSMLSFTAGGRVFEGAVTPVISGYRAARPAMEAERVRYAFYDGRLDDLGTRVPASFIPLISSNWTQSFTWSGVGPMPRAERAKLRQIVDTAHARRQRVRFWATPDQAGSARDAVWSELLAAGVDHLNTDDLAGLEAFLRAAR